MATVAPLIVRPVQARGGKRAKLEPGCAAAEIRGRGEQVPKKMK